jgi:hypothetical protein
MDHHIHSKMCVTFKLVSVDWGRERAARTPDMEEHVLEHVDRDARVSMEEVEEKLRLAHANLEGTA